MKSGDVFGKLIVVKKAENRNGFWLCNCACGNLVERNEYNLKKGIAKQCGTCARTKDITNKKFGGWIVLQREGFNSSRSATWLCECQCGFRRIISSDELKKRDIGFCKKCDNEKRSNSNPNTIDLMKGTYWGKLVRAAKRRDIEVNVTAAEAYEIFKEQNGLCAISGVPLNFNVRAIETIGTASLDRKNSNGSYSVDNIQWVHKAINKMKMEISEETFLEWCAKITNHQATKL